MQTGHGDNVREAGDRPSGLLTPTGLLGDIASRLDLDQAEENRFWGAYRGYPVAIAMLPVPVPDDIFGSKLAPELRAAALAEMPRFTLMLQIRHPLAGKELPPSDAFDWGPELRSLVTDRKATVAVEDRIVWLSLDDGPATLLAGRVVPMLDAAVDALVLAGVKNDDRCHYCRRSPGRLRLVRGRVAQICEPCLVTLTGRASAVFEAYPFRRLLVPPALAAGVLFCGTVWSGLWIAHNELFGWIGVCHVPLPEMAFVLVAFLCGFLIAGPVAWLTRAVLPRSRLSMVLTVAAVVAGALVGELGFAVWVMFRENYTFSLSAGLQALPWLWLEGSVFYAAPRVVLAIAAIVVAAEMTRPEKHRDI